MVMANSSALGRLRDRLGEAAVRPLVMGILNVTPDSFSDGGRFDAVPRALAHARAMVAEGADIVDVGGESTRPGASFVEAEVEAARVVPVIAALSAEGKVPVSVDTYKASVARAAVGAGAVMVNDVWGLQRDPAMADVVAEAGVAVVVMHNRAEVDAGVDILDDLLRFFERSLVLAERAGVLRARVVLDPGVGFGKTLEQNLACVARVRELRAAFGLPVLLGLSRKSFIGKVLGNEVGDRLVGTLAAHLGGVERGAGILRVHDVRAHVEALAMRAAIGGAGV